MNEFIKSTTNNLIPIEEGYYTINYISGECHCWYFIWNRLLRNICKYYHVAKIYKKSIEQIYIEMIYNTKVELIQYFHNKERIVSHSKKNELIYFGDVEVAF